MGRKRKPEPKLADWHFVTWTSKRGDQIKEDFNLEYGGMTFNDLREEMDRIEKEYGDQYSDFKIEVDTDYDIVGDEIITTFVLGYREETDEEYQERMEIYRQAAEQKRQRELALLETLKERYGDE